MKLTWYPADSSTEVVFDKDATDGYKLLKAYHGFSKAAVDHIVADRAPGQQGRTRKTTVLDTREISFDIMIESDDLEEQQSLVAALATKFNPLLGVGVLKRENEDGAEYLIYCIGDSTPTLDESDRTQTSQRATIDLIAHDPFIYSGSPSIKYLDPNPPNFFPFPSGTGTWPFTLASTTSTVSCPNTGQVETPVKICIFGPITNPVLTVTKIVDGETVSESLSLTMTLAAGDEVEIDTDPDVMTARYYPAGGGDLNAMPYIDSDSKFWKLAVGGNSVHITCTTSSTGSSANIEWSNRYVGI